MHTQQQSKRPGPRSREGAGGSDEEGGEPGAGDDDDDDDNDEFEVVRGLTYVPARAVVRRRGRRSVRVRLYSTSSFAVPRK